jgi:hypothetical protein
MKTETIREQQKILSKLTTVMTVLRMNEREAGCPVLCRFHGNSSGKEYDVTKICYFPFV